MGHASYRERADLYDRIYEWKDYQAESRRLSMLLRNAGVAPGSRVLEVACGTGCHMQFLAEDFELTGTDLNEGMLEVARERLPDHDFFASDMAELTVPEPFDALLCLFSSIGYMHGTGQLQRAARAFAGAVVPGGVVVIEPWIFREDFVDGTPSLYTWEDEDLKIARACVVRVGGSRSILDFHWMVARRGEGVERFSEHHELSMFSRRQILDALDDAGIDGRHHAVGLTDRRGLFVGRRR
jgi:SAM-dependent methyltransferase